MRRFDLQIKVVQDYERQCLMTRDPEEGKGLDERQYVELVNAKVEQDLVTIKELFSIKEVKTKGNEELKQ
jgi:hypothetical protein